MEHQNEEALTPVFMRAQLKVMANLDLSEQAAERHALFAGLVAVMNMLQPEGLLEAVPAFTFRPLKE